MAATPTVTTEEIRLTGEALLAANRPVTGYALRSQLGHRGEAKRLTTVWQQMQDATNPADQSPASPPRHRPYRPTWQRKPQQCASIL